MENPYLSPSSSSPAPTNSEFALYSAGQMGWATFLGTPLAGCVLMALNFRRLGQNGAGNVALIAGVFATMLTMVVAFLLPENFPNFALPAAYTFGFVQTAKILQQDAFEQHLRSGGRKASSWAATGIGLLVAILLIAAIFAVLLMLPEAWLEEI